MYLSVLMLIHTQPECTCRLSASLSLTVSINIMQVIVADSVDMTRTSAPVLASVRIQSVNDEPPLITNTSAVVQFHEEDGPVRIVDNSVSIVDRDNCENHTTVLKLIVRLENPVAREDVLIVGEEVYNYTVTFSCDPEVEGRQCYEDFLRSIEYNNTNQEPESYAQNRIISIQVWMKTLIMILLLYSICNVCCMFYCICILSCAGL